MAQLRRGYPEIERSGTEVLQITHNTPTEAQRYFKQFPIVFPYLCDADRTVHDAYGLPLQPTTVSDGVTSFVAAASDLIRHGERTALPIPFFRRHGMMDSPQAVVFVDRDGIVRDVVQAGPNANLPSNAEILHRLAAIR